MSAKIKDGSEALATSVVQKLFHHLSPFGLAVYSHRSRWIPKLRRQNTSAGIGSDGGKGDAGELHDADCQDGCSDEDDRANENEDGTQVMTATVCVNHTSAMLLMVLVRRTKVQRARGQSRQR